MHYTVVLLLSHLKHVSWQCLKTETCPQHTPLQATASAHSQTHRRVKPKPSSNPLEPLYAFIPKAPPVISCREGSAPSRTSPNHQQFTRVNPAILSIPLLRTALSHVRAPIKLPFKLQHGSRPLLLPAAAVRGTSADARLLWARSSCCSRAQLSTRLPPESWKLHSRSFTCC